MHFSWSYGEGKKNKKSCFTRKQLKTNLMNKMYVLEVDTYKTFFRFFLIRTKIEIEKYSNFFMLFFKVTLLIFFFCKNILKRAVFSKLERKENKIISFFREQLD